MSKQYIMRPVAWIVCPVDERRIYGEHAYRIEIDDEGGGEYVRIESLESSSNPVLLDSEAWETVADSVQFAINEIERHATVKNGLTVQESANG